MRNRAGKDAIRWCHLTHQFIAGASVHSRKPKISAAEVYRYFFEEIYKPYLIIKGALYRILCGVNRLGDSDVNVV